MTGRALIDHDRLLDVLVAEGELMADTADGARPDLPIPSRPTTTLADTIRHVGGVFRMVAARLRGGNGPVKWQSEPPPGGALVEFLRGGLHELVDELQSHPADEVCASWWPLDQTYGFWRRRMAHEATMHRIDLQSATGIEVFTVDEDVAVDGVDEALTLWFAHRLSVIGVSGSSEFKVAVRAGGRTWLVSSHGDNKAAWRASPADTKSVQATVTGEPMTVYLWLWGRLPFTAVRITGDMDAVAALWALLRLATH
ncbi:MAG TPA: maleylpyruvate isomerase family mycothiol-dependent enzyme [Kutzneria sp.]|nr:maleylpyruvate isomerase family mycothiol-dependent enzyme [Kutzneria sp.]